MKLELKHIAPYLPYNLSIYYKGIVNGKELSDYDKKFDKAIGTGGLTSDIEKELEKIGTRPDDIIDWKVGLVKKIHTYKSYWNIVVGNGHKNLYVRECGDEFKLILRPLSDLTKEIEVNGERFVPLQVLYSMMYEHNNVEVDCRLLDKNYVGTQVNTGRVIAYDFEAMVFRGYKHFGKTERDFEYKQYELFEKLFEWHFDFQGLIPHLAIDINTLNQNNDINKQSNFNR